MPLSISCSTCGAKLRVPDNAAGRKFKCPKCGNQILVAPVTASRDQQRGSLQSSEVPDHGSIKRQADPAGEAIAASKLSLGFGIASLALSVIGMVFSLIPCIGAWFAIPLCGLGLLLGIVGAIFALIRQGRGIGFPLAGSITGFAGLGIAIMWLTICTGIFSSGARSVDEAAKRQKKKEVDARKNSADTPKRDIQPYRLAASVTWTDAGTRQIGLKHGGIPGSIIAGNHRFTLAPEAPWPNVLVGQKVECVMEWRNGQWVVSQVNPAQSVEPAKKQPFDRNRDQVRKVVNGTNADKRAVDKNPDLRPLFDDKEMVRPINEFRGYSIEDHSKLPNCLDVFKECLAVPYEGKTAEQYKSAALEVSQKPCRMVLKVVDVSAEYDFAEFELMTDDGKPGVGMLKQGGDLGNYTRHLRAVFPINNVKKKGFDSKRRSVGDRLVLVGLGYVVDASRWGARDPRNGMPRGDERQVMLRAFGKPNKYHPNEYEFSFMVRNWYIASQ
jgi:predicted RNA-binding Zn-ribbon protein involved in translation (DUF1610 family)